MYLLRDLHTWLHSYLYLHSWTEIQHMRVIVYSCPLYTYKIEMNPNWDMFEVHVCDLAIIQTPYISKSFVNALDYVIMWRKKIG